MSLTGRLLARIHSDFPSHVPEVILAVREVESGTQDRERVVATVLIDARGDLTRLRKAIALSQIDWRDALVSGGLANADWPQRLDNWLGPPRTRPVEIVEYRPTWQGDFNRHAARLRSSLGTIAVRVDHIGSTSVPRLVSKNRIDIQIGVKALPSAGELIEPLERAGFTLNQAIGMDHQPPGWNGDPAEWRKRFAKDRGSDPPVNVHIRRGGAANWRYALLFRDYLRTHDAAATAYAEAKRRLSQVCDASAEYAEAKDPVCDIVMVGAERWAADTGWQPEEGE